MVPLAGAGGSSHNPGLCQVPHLSGIKILYLKTIPGQINHSGPLQSTLTTWQDRRESTHSLFRGWNVGFIPNPAPLTELKEERGQNANSHGQKPFGGGLAQILYTSLHSLYLSPSRACVRSPSSTEEAGSAYTSVLMCLWDLMAAGCAHGQNTVAILGFSGHPVPLSHTPTVKDFFPIHGPHTLSREHGSARKGGAGERRKWVEGWEELTGPREVKWIRGKESQ